MFLRAYKLSDPPYLDNEIDFIFHIFMSRGYDYSTINHIFQNTKKKIYDPTPPKIYSTEKGILMPYSEGLLSLRFLLKSTFNIQIIFHFPTTLNSFLVKNNSIIDLPGGVYNIPCASCDSFYIGETIKTLNFRISQHLNDIKKGNYSNSIFKHTIETGHKINWEDSKMIFSSNDKLLNQLIESFFISTTKNFNTFPRVSFL